MIHTIVCANNRPDYIARVLASLDQFHPTVPRTVVNDTDRQGMAINVQHGFDTFLDTDAAFALWIEDDMELLHELPLWGAISALGRYPETAQMCFRREVVAGNPTEMQLGDQLAAICAQAKTFQERETYTVHDFIFSLNPCLIPRHVIELGWDHDNEAGMTRKLLDKGYVFGSWGHPGDGQVWARHIGDVRGQGWKL